MNSGGSKGETLQCLTAALSHDRVVSDTANMCRLTLCSLPKVRQASAFEKLAGSEREQLPWWPEHSSWRGGCGPQETNSSAARRREGGTRPGGLVYFPSLVRRQRRCSGPPAAG